MTDDLRIVAMTIGNNGRIFGTDDKAEVWAYAQSEGKEGWGWVKFAEFIEAIAKKTEEVKFKKEIVS